MVNIFRRKKVEDSYLDADLEFLHATTPEDNQRYMDEYEPKVLDFLGKIDSKSLKFSSKAYRVSVRTADHIHRKLEWTPYNVAFLARRGTYEEFRYSPDLRIRRYNTQELWNTIVNGNSTDMFMAGEGYFDKLGNALDSNAKLQLKIDEMTNQLDDLKSTKEFLEGRIDQIKSELKGYPVLHEKLFPEDSKPDLQSTIENEGENKDDSQ